MFNMGKECGFPSNFDILRLFTACKTELRRKTELQPIKSPKHLLFAKEEVDQQSHFGDEIVNCSNLT